MWLDAYKARMNAVGNIKQSIEKNSKISARNEMLSSPSLVYVSLNDSTDIPCIVNDMDTFLKRRFLFLPDTEIFIGDYIHYDGYVYLATKQTTDKIHPQLIGEVCNNIFKLQLKPQRVIVDRDEFNKPIYDYIYEINDEVPCVLKDSPYASTKNSPIPLLDGSVSIKIPYNPQKMPPVNYKFTINNQDYIVKNLSYENIIGNKGYIEIIASVDIKGDSNDN